MSSEEEIYQSSSEVLQKTMKNQQRAYERVNQLADDLAKIDLLTVSVVLAGVSFSALSLSLPLVAGLMTFVYALWCCTRVYEPRSFTHGIGTDAVEEIGESVQEGRDVEEHYRELMFSYGNAISHLSVAYSSVRTRFRHALWASVTAIAFFSFVAIRRLLPSYPWWLDGIVLVVVSAVVLWGKDKYEQE
jgi:fatty acid desaturase